MTNIKQEVYNFITNNPTLFETNQIYQPGQKATKFVGIYNDIQVSAYPNGMNEYLADGWTICFSRTDEPTEENIAYDFYQPDTNNVENFTLTVMNSNYRWDFDSENNKEILYNVMYNNEEPPEEYANYGIDEGKSFKDFFAKLKFVNELSKSLPSKESKTTRMKI